MGSLVLYDQLSACCACGGAVCAVVGFIKTGGTLNYASAGPVYGAGEKEKEKLTNPCGHTTATSRQE